MKWNSTAKMWQNVCARDLSCTGTIECVKGKMQKMQEMMLEDIDIATVIGLEDVPGFYCAGVRQAARISTTMKSVSFQDVQCSRKTNYQRANQLDTTAGMERHFKTYFFYFFKEQKLFLT